MTAAVRTTALAKFFNGRAAVRDLDWEVPEGSAWGLLGHNGAGKSTTLRMLMGFTPPTSGHAEVLGEPADAMTPATRARLGYVAELPVLPGWTRLRELVAFHRRFYPRWDEARAQRLLATFELPDSQRVSTLSKGQNRRLMLVLALSQGADLLLLDEPGSGLDVQARRQLLGLLGDYLGEEQRSFVLSSHIVSDVERIVSHVAIMAHGRLVEACALDDLLEQVRRVRLPAPLWEQSQLEWQRGGLLGYEFTGNAAVATVRNASVVDRELRQHRAVELTPLGLEDAFLAISEAASPATGAQAS